MSELKSTIEFAADMRVAIEKVADGSEPFMRIPLAFIENSIAEPKKINPSYIRTTLNRVPCVKAVGKISVKLEENDGAMFYKVTINRDAKRKVLTSNDLDSLHAKWQAKFIKQLLNTQPRITDLDGDKLDGAAIALERFAEMLKDMIKEEA